MRGTKGERSPMIYSKAETRSFGLILLCLLANYPNYLHFFQRPYIRRQHWTFLQVCKALYLDVTFTWPYNLRNLNKNNFSKRKHGYFQNWVSVTGPNLWDNLDSTLKKLNYNSFIHACKKYIVNGYESITFEYEKMDYKLYKCVLTCICTIQFYTIIACFI